MSKRESIVPTLLLDTKTDIPFSSAQVTIYQPSIKEISMIGESDFLIGVSALSKDYKSMNKDNSDLSELSNFDILMSILKENSDNSKKIAMAIDKVLFLIFPHYKIGFTPRSILLQETIDDKKEIHHIDGTTFDEFGQIIFEMFCLAEMTGETSGEYNPMGDRARALVEKFRKKRELLAELRKERGENDALLSIYGRYINILAIGERKDKNQLAQYSVYQLIEEFKRFQLKEAFDYTFQAKMAGATKIKDAKDWMSNIHFGVETED